MPDRRFDVDVPRLDREAQARLRKALRTTLPVDPGPLPTEQADLIARLPKAKRPPDPAR